MKIGDPIDEADVPKKRSGRSEAVIPPEFEEALTRAAPDEMVPVEVGSIVEAEAITQRWRAALWRARKRGAKSKWLGFVLVQRGSTVYVGRAK